MIGIRALTLPPSQLENVTAPSAGGFPGPDGESSGLRMRLPFRTGSSYTKNLIPFPTPTPILTMIGLIGNHCLEAMPNGARLFGWAQAKIAGNEN